MQVRPKLKGPNSINHSPKQPRQSKVGTVLHSRLSRTVPGRSQILETNSIDLSQSRMSPSWHPRSHKVSPLHVSRCYLCISYAAGHSSDSVHTRKDLKVKWCGAMLVVPSHWKNITTSSLNFYMTFPSHKYFIHTSINYFIQCTKQVNNKKALSIDRVRGFIFI